MWAAGPPKPTEGPMPRAAVCYTASSGYLFQTIVSALQARRHTEDDIAVYIIFFGPDDSAEAEIFGRICAENDIVLTTVSAELLGGLQPNYGRLFLDQILPPEVEEYLYLDGDTQILGDITPLVRATAPEGGILAARDPMVFIREINRHLGGQIDAWWNGSSIPDRLRGDYVNSGVMRVSRSALPDLRAACLLVALGPGGSEMKFSDQDAINLAADGRVGVLSMRWNYPGFLLDTQIADLVPPRIVHFMSNPRPWNAPFRPWGRAFYQPYEELVSRYPETDPYWTRFTGLRRYRYVLQQLGKRLVEGRQYQTPAAAQAVSVLQSRDMAL